MGNNTTLEEAEEAAKAALIANKTKVTTEGYFIEWHPDSALNLFALNNPHSWYPVSVPNKTTKWYRVSTEKNITAEWVKGLLLFNLQIECCDSVATNGRQQPNYPDQKIVVPLKRKNIASLSV